MSSKGPLTTAPPPARGGYSAKVRIRLHIDGQIFRVAQVGGGRIYFDSPVTLPASAGTLVVTVDGHEERWLARMRASSVGSRIITAHLTPA